MENSTFILTYLSILAICLILTIGLIILIQKGLKRYYENLSQDAELTRFFIKITNIVIFLGGASAGLRSDYNTREDANWLTLTWNATDQLQESLRNLFMIMMIFAIFFLILHLYSRKINK
jgi:hypothetical protein